MSRRPDKLVGIFLSFTFQVNQNQFRTRGHPALPENWSTKMLCSTCMSSKRVEYRSTANPLAQETAFLCPVQYELRPRNSDFLSRGTALETTKVGVYGHCGHWAQGPTARRSPTKFCALLAKISRVAAENSAENRAMWADEEWEFCFHPALMGPVGSHCF